MPEPQQMTQPPTTRVQAVSYESGPVILVDGNDRDLGVLDKAS